MAEWLDMLDAINVLDEGNERRPVPRVIRDHQNPFEEYCDKEFRLGYRFQKDSVVDFLEEIRPEIVLLHIHIWKCSSPHPYMVCFVFPPVLPCLMITLASTVVLRNPVVHGPVPPSWHLTVRSGSWMIRLWLRSVDPDQWTGTWSSLVHTRCG